MGHILVLSGAGRYADNIHDFDATSEAVSQVLTERGHQVEVRRSYPEALDHLAGADLLIVNTGGGDPEEEWEAGKPILGLHPACNTFCDWDLWSSILGGKWVLGVSGHPERSYAVFEPMPEAADHPILRGVEQVVVYDERYSDLDINPLATPLLFHETGEEFHPMCWVMGNSVVYDGLGHSPRSYYSASRRQLLCNEVSWLLNWKRREAAAKGAAEVNPSSTQPVL